MNINCRKLCLFHSQSSSQTATLFPNSIMDTPAIVKDLVRFLLTDEEPLPHAMISEVVTTNMPDQVALLMRLPSEIHLKIIAYLSDLELIDIYRLRLSNKYFYNTISAPDHATLLVLEETHFAIEHSLYACKHCLRLRHASKFADTSLRRKTCRYGDYAMKRFCTDCGFDTNQPQRYMRGTQVKVNGELWVRCVHCDKVKRGSEVEETACKEACKRCHDRWGCRRLEASMRCKPKKPQMRVVYEPWDLSVDCMDWRDLLD